jgi:glycerol kinase
MSHVLALDQGTTSSRAIVFDSDGVTKAVAQREFTQFFPAPGLVEHDPTEIWLKQRSCALEALAQANLKPQDVAAIGITNQRETTVLWDRKTGEPVGRALVWQDRRTAELCARMHQDGRAKVVQKKTGLVVDSYFSATKLAWLLDHVDDARVRAERGELAFGTIDSWLVWNLTGGRVHATDASNASRTMLYDLAKGRWDDELCELFDVPHAVLPEICDSSGHVGEAQGGLAGIPITGIAGDQQAALFGQACFTPGLAKNTYGTGCFLLTPTGTKPKRSRHRLLSTVAWRVGGETEFALEGGVFVGGAVVQWLRDGLGIIAASEDVEALANKVPDSGGVVLVPAFAGLGAPHWDGFARGTICGLTRGTTAAHIARAALESIALQVADLVATMEKDTGHELAELRVDGGAARDGTLMQMQADVLGIPVVRPANIETTALGAAWLAGLAAGVWRSRGELQEHWQVGHRFEPKASGDRVQELRARWNSAVERAKGWVKGEQAERS